jgi:DNA modification methylase
MKDDGEKSYLAAIEAKRDKALAAIKREVVIGDARLLLGDCLDILPAIGAVHAVVTDPPYGIGESSKKAATRGKLAAARDYGGAEDWDQEPADPRVIEWMLENSQFAAALILLARVGQGEWR